MGMQRGQYERETSPSPPPDLEKKRKEKQILNYKNMQIKLQHNFKCLFFYFIFFL